MRLRRLRLFREHSPFTASVMDQDTTLLASPQSPPNPSHPTLRTTKSTAFKREERRRRKERKRQDKLADALCRWDPLSSKSNQPHPSNQTVSVSDTPWPCDPNPPANNDSSEWTPFVQPFVPPKPTPSAPLVCTQDVQISALKKCRKFFQGGEEEEGENGVYAEEEGNGNDTVLGFFSDLFQVDAGLRRLYEERRDKGVLFCLVCEKKFGSCTSLLHHASTVTKTKWRRAHRVYGVAMSQVLGLDTNQLGFSKGDASGSEGAELDQEEMEI